MLNKLCIQWPALERGSDAWRYARAFEQRLLDLQVPFAVNSDGQWPAEASACVEMTLSAAASNPFQQNPSNESVRPELVEGQSRQGNCGSTGSPRTVTDLLKRTTSHLPFEAWLIKGHKDSVSREAMSELPVLSASETLLAKAGNALAGRPDPGLVTYVVFPAMGDDSWPGQVVSLQGQLGRLASCPVRLVAALPIDVAAAQSQQLRLPGDIVCCSVLADDFPRLLLRADAALALASASQNLFAAIEAGVPLVVAAADDNYVEFGGAGLAVSDASSQELAGLLVLLTTEPGLRRKVLDGQEAFRRIHSPEHQAQALVDWLKEAGIEAGSVPAESETLPVLRVEGLFDSSYSLAIVNRQLALALEALGQRTALYTYEQGPDPQPDWQSVEAPERLKAMWTLGSQPRPPAVSMRNAWPPEVRDMRAQRRVLASYAWEETAFPPEFAADFNARLDLITVVSEQTARLLRDAGVTTPIAVVGNGVDHLLGVAPAPLPRPLQNARFRFLHMSSCFPRKGADALLRAYGKAFRSCDDVALVIKTFPNPHNDVAAQLERMRLADPGYPRVDLIEEDWTQAQIVGLYGQCHALVAPSRAEGFGLPIAEAMLYKLPVIITGWGGYMDFCTPDTSWLIDFMPQYARTHLGLDNSLWAEPDANHLAQLMKEIHVLPPSDLAVKTECARKRIMETYTWRKVAERTLAALEWVDAQPGLKPAPRVGWISTWGSRCGIAAYSQHLIGAFAGEGLHVFAPLGEVTEEDDPDFVTRNWRQGQSQVDQLVADIKSRRLDALVIQHNWGFFLPPTLGEILRAAHAEGIKTYVEFHNTNSTPHTISAPDTMGALHDAERLLVHTLDDVQRLKGLGFSDNVTLFPLAVYPISQPGERAIAEQRRRLGLEGRRVIASYGFLLPHKGLLQLVEAMPRLLQDCPDVHLLMVNAIYSVARSGAELKKLQERIHELNLHQHVTLQTDFLPEVDSLALLKVAELAIFPYQYTEESSSAAVRMGLVAGLPVAVTPLPIFEDVAHAVSRLPGVDPASLGQGIVQLLNDLANKEKRSAAMERNARFVANRQANLLSRRLRGLVEGGLNDAPMGLAS